MAAGNVLRRGTVCKHTTLPFGLRSTPIIFTAVADAAKWIAKRAEVK